MSDTLQRFTQIGGAMTVGHDTFTGKPIGEWVRYSDFERALTAAKAEARREAIEECARVCEQVHDNFGVKRQFEAATGAAVCLTEIRALSASKEG